MLALTVDSAKNIALIVLAGVLLLGILAVKITKSVTQKAISVLLMGGIALGVWTQRSNLSSCADKLKERAASGITEVSDLSCTFFGTDVQLSLDTLTGN